jgi:electron transfer flavoprotein beta subunit
MKARQKPIETIPPEALGVDLAPRLSVLSVAEPPKRNGGRRVKTVDELVDKLRNEAKIV